jgi:putative transposase
MRTKHSGAFKAKVALESLKGQKTMAQLASEYGVHANQIQQWKKKLAEALPGIFENRQGKRERAADELEAELYRQIGQLKVELDWLKKKCDRFPG